MFKDGAPKEHLSDNGSQFVSLFFQQFYQLLCIDNAFTTMFHPQIKGQAEKFNRSLAAMLRCYVEDCPSE